jgi:membrane protease YdiL (CAAX protease family)
VSSRAIEFAGVLLVAVVYPTLYELAVGSAGPPTAPLMLVTMPLYAGMAAVIGALLMRGPGRPLRPREEWRGWGQQLMLCVPLLLGIWLVDVMVTDALRRLGVPTHPTAWDAAFSDAAVVAVFPVTAFFAALYEELVFRAYLLTRLKAWMGSAPALLLSALCFAAIHSSYSPRERATLFVAGLLYGVGWLGTRSLVALVAAHWAHNMVVMLLAKH